MSAIDLYPSGFSRPDPWSLPAAKVEVRPTRSTEVLVASGEGRERVWVLNPYSGCEFACSYCSARRLPPFEGADPRLFERDIHLRANAAEAVQRALRDGSLYGARLELGTTCDPWQPAERQARATRGALEVLARFGRVELYASTRSTLAPRDGDLLSAIARNGRARVAFSIGSLELRLTRLLEPLAPTPDRRLVAMEALARSGVEVGVAISPVVAGCNDSLSALEALLRRARSAGASFASVQALSMPQPARERLVRFVARFDPERASRFNRLLARSAESDPHFASRLQQRFAEACRQVGLEPLPAPGAAPLAPRRPRQLSLFPPPQDQL